MSSDEGNLRNNPGLGNAGPEPRGVRVCANCNTPLASGYDGDFCPVCLLRSALNDTAGLDTERSDASTEPDSSKLRFEHYELVLREDGTPLELGKGAMGITYKATDINLRVPVALKVVNARYLDDKSVRERFISEARAAASLRHPNVASVFHLGKIGVDYFYAMELVEGEPLDRVLRFRGPIDTDLALEIADQVAAALSAAYQRGLVHRDIKPSNLIVAFQTEGRVMVKVIDFGLAKPFRAPVSERRLSEAGRFFGTPHFASPEQCLGKEVDIRSDLYSLGVTLWVMLTGQAPFDGPVTEVMQKHVHEAPPVERLEHVPRPVVRLIESLLDKDPAKRPQTPYELRTMIQQVRKAVATDLPIAAGLKRPSRLDRFRRWSWRKTLFILGSAALAIMVVCLPFVYRREPPIDPKSVAVLPFDNVGDDKRNEYFSDGLTGEVIFQLSKIPDIRVISRSSVMRYKALPNTAREGLREIGEELEVATILESSVQRLGDRVKIVAILYDAQSNRRLWGESYDRQITDLFAIQSDVAENIAAALQVRLSADQRASVTQRPTENLNAYDLYLRGLALYELLHKDDNEKAILFFRQALEQDSRFALAYVGIADAYIERAMRFDAGAFWLDSAIDLCQQAISLDAHQSRSYMVLARAYFYKHLWDRAREEVGKALKLTPNDELANLLAAELLTDTGQFADWYEAERKCHVLNPNDPYEPYNLGLICAIVGSDNLMEKWLQRAISLETDPVRSRILDSERMIFRRDFRGAIEALRQLAPDLHAYGYSVTQLTVACSERLGDWSTVQQLTNAELEKGREEQWAGCHLAIALRALGDDANGRLKMERVVQLAREQLELNGKDFFAKWYLAVGIRFLGVKEEAYRNLRTIFPAILGCQPLLQHDYGLDIFLPDAEFQTMLSEFDKQNEVNRARIRAIEGTL